MLLCLNNVTLRLLIRNIRISCYSIFVQLELYIVESGTELVTEPGLSFPFPGLRGNQI